MINFEGAKSTSYNAHWQVTPEMNADTELASSDNLKTLRLRVRQLIKDDPVVGGIQQAYINGICGKGPAISCESESRVQKKQVNDLIEEVTNGIDMTSTLSLNEILEEIVAWSFCDGDLLINLPIDNQREGVQTVVELIEAQRIKSPTGMDQTVDKESNVRNGVSYDSAGRIKGYWVKKYNKVDEYSDAKENFNFFPMYKMFGGIRRKVTFLFKAPLNNRPKMSRQYPVLTPCITLFKHLKDYQEAILVGARVAACFSAFVKSANPAAVMKGFTTDSSGNTTYNPDETKRVQKLQPGQVFYLRPNEDINFGAPNRPSDNHDAYILRIYKTIAMYVRYPYPLLFLDPVEVNYSAWRGSALEAMKMIDRWRRNLNNVIDWILNTMIFEGMTLGEVRGNLKNVKIKKRWPAAGILDAEKEARANKIELQNRTTSVQKICDENGTSYEEVRSERLQEDLDAKEDEALKLKKMKELETEHGIIFPENMAEEEANRETERRPGEQEGEDLDEEDAAERRKEDGNI